MAEEQKKKKKTNLLSCPLYHVARKGDVLEGLRGRTKRFRSSKGITIIIVMIGLAELLLQKKKVDEN